VDARASACHSGMHRAIIVEEGGKAGGMGTRNRYGRDHWVERGHSGDLGGHAAESSAKYEHGPTHHNGYNSTISSSSSASRDHSSVNSGNRGGTSSAATLAEVEKRIAAMQHDFKQALHKVNGKDNEKFDLIFAILSELQNRQAQLEETVRMLKAQCSAPMSSAGSGQVSSGQQPFVPRSDSSQSYSSMGGQMGHGGQHMFAAVPQVLVVPSPTGAMQTMDGYPMQQLMSPTGAMQQIAHPMAMQFMGQAPGPDYGWGADGTGAGGGQAGGGLEAAQQQLPLATPDATGEGGAHVPEQQGTV